MNQDFTCKKHGLVVGRLFASGDLMCSKCLFEATEAALANLTPEEQAKILKPRPFSMSAQVDNSPRPGPSMGALVPGPKKDW